MSLKHHLIIAAAFSFYLPHLASADKLELANGDQISGTLSGWSEGKLQFTTAYGVLQVEPAALKQLQTDAPRAVKTDAGQILAGAITANAESLSFSGGDSPQEIAWPQVTVLAESPEALMAALAAIEEKAKPEAAEKKKVWSGHADTGLNLRRGNTNTTDWNFSTELLRQGEGNKLTLKGLAAYGEVEEVLNTRKFLAEAKWQVYPQEEWYYYVLGGAERDDGRKLSLRTNAALGIGRDFVKKERMTLSADIGLDYAWERWSPYTPAERDALKDTRRAAALEGLRTLALGLGNGNLVPNLEALRQFVGHASDYRDPLRTDFDREEDYLSLRGSANYKQTVRKESTLSDTLAVFANAEDPGEFRINNEAAFLTPLTKELKLNLTLRTAYDSLAEEKGADPWDNTLITGLRYEF